MMTNQENIHYNNILTFPNVRHCACGCGKVIRSRDSKGREVRYFCGHNRRKDRSVISIEVDKITDIEQAKDIIIQQSRIIYELQHLIEQQDNPTKERYTEYPKTV